MRHFQKADGHPNTRAFTLVELLVSMAVLSILMIILVQITGSVANTWNASNGRAERRQNGRAVVDFIGRELRAAALPSGTQAIPGRANLEFVMNPSFVPDAYKNPCALFWQAPLASDTTQGDMAVLGYFVRWDGNHASLCRLFVNPSDAANYFVYDSAHLNNWINQTVINQKASAASTSGYIGLFADNVIGFWARCFDSGGNLISTPTGVGFDSNKGYTDKNGSGTSTAVPAPALPASVEVSVVLLDTRTAAKITAATASAINSLAHTAVNAADFIQSMQQQSALYPLLVGTSSHELRVYLENAP